MTDIDKAEFRAQVEEHLAEAMYRSSPIEWPLEVAIADEITARGWVAWRCVRHGFDGSDFTGIVRIQGAGGLICCGYVFRFDETPRDPPLVAICREVPREQYRLDLHLRTLGAQLAVECDGHEYHDRTKEQAAHDRARDRKLLINQKLATVRFTGSEIHADVKRCARECIDALVAQGAKF